MPSLPVIEKDVEKRARKAGDHGAFDAPAAGEPDPARFDYLLRLGDDALILGQRLGEWCGHAPAVEVDLSLANLALDQIGQGTLLLSAAGEAEGAGRDADALAFHRDVLDYKNCLLVEQPNGDFARTIARHLLMSTYQHMLYQRLAESTDTRAGGDRRQGGQGSRLPPRAGRRMDGAAGRRDRGERQADGRRARLVLALHSRIVRGRRDAGSADRARDRRRSAQFEDEYRAAIGAVLAEAKLEAPPEQRPILGGRRGHHSEHLGHLLAVMQHLPRTYPDAIW